MPKEEWTPPAVPPKVTVPAAPPTQPPPAPPTQPTTVPLALPFQEGLTYLDMPEPLRATDTTDMITGYGPSPSTGQRDQLRGLTVGDEILLLAQNNIKLSAKAEKKGAPPLGSMPGYVMTGSFEPSSGRVVRFRKLRLMSENTNRIDSASYAYRTHESSLQKNLVISAKLGAGVPPIFKFETSASHKNGILMHDEGIEMHFQASQSIPKARVVFERNDISLDGDFVKKIEGACDRRDTNELLALLRENGQFVPLSIVLGGRILLLIDKTLTNKSDFERTEDELKAAATARYVVDGVTLEGNAATGVGSIEDRKKSLSAQAKSLHMELKGGNETLASSEAGTLGTKWIDTMGPYAAWRTIGFTEGSLVPIIEFLSKPYADICKDMLRKYFAANLTSRHSEAAGHADGKKFDRDISKVKRLARIVVNHEGNIDGMKLTYEIEGSTGPAQDKCGNDRGKQHDATIELAKGEAITKINALVDTKSDNRIGLLKQLQFVTNTGNKHPGDKSFYGKNRGDTLMEIEAPRVRGIYGYTGAYVHSVGLSYLQLAHNVQSREYLLAMEPYLFPDQDYGAIGK